MATASGLPLAISSVTAQVVVPPLPTSSLAGTSNITWPNQGASSSSSTSGGASTSTFILEWPTTSQPSPSLSSLSSSPVASTLAPQPAAAYPDNFSGTALNTTPALGPLSPLLPSVGAGAPSAAVIAAAAASAAAVVAVAIALWVGCHRRLGKALLVEAKAAAKEGGLTAGELTAALAYYRGECDINGIERAALRERCDAERGADVERGECAEKRGCRPTTPMKSSRILPWQQGLLVFYSPVVQPEFRVAEAGDFRSWG